MNCEFHDSKKYQKEVDDYIVCIECGLVINPCSSPPPTRPPPSAALSEYLNNNEITKEMIYNCHKLALKLSLIFNLKTRHFVDLLETRLKTCLTLKLPIYSKIFQAALIHSLCKYLNIAIPLNSIFKAFNLSHTRLFFSYLSYHDIPFTTNTSAENENFKIDQYFEQLFDIELIELMVPEKGLVERPPQSLMNGLVENSQQSQSSLEKKRHIKVAQEIRNLYLSYDDNYIISLSVFAVSCAACSIEALSGQKINRTSLEILAKQLSCSMSSVTMQMQKIHLSLYYSVNRMSSSLQTSGSKKAFRKTAAYYNSMEDILISHRNRIEK